MIGQRVWTQQPQVAAQVSSSSIASGIVGIFNAAVNKLPAINGASYPVTQAGIGYRGGNGAIYFTASSTALASLNPTWTILAYGLFPFNGINDTGIYVERPGAVQIVKLGVNSGTFKGMLTVRDLSSNLIQLQGATTVTSGIQTLVGVRYASNDHRVFVNGAQDGSSATNINGSFGATASVIGCDPQSSQEFLSGSASIVVVWNRALSPAEIATIGTNPWQLFAPLQRPIFVGIPLTVSATLPDYPSADVATTGWTTTPGPTYYGMLNEVSFNDTNFVTSPTTPTAQTLTMRLQNSLPAGTYSLNVRGMYSGFSGQVRVHVQNDSFVDQGITPWQVLTTSATSYFLPITTTGTGTLVVLEVQ
jgi:hypothetical protein